MQEGFDLNKRKMGVKWRKNGHPHYNQAFANATHLKVKEETPE